MQREELDYCDCAGPRAGDSDHGFVDGAYFGRAFQPGGDDWILGDQKLSTMDTLFYWLAQLAGAAAAAFCCAR